MTKKKLFTPETTDEPTGHTATWKDGLRLTRHMTWGRDNERISLELEWRGHRVQIEIGARVLWVDGQQVPPKGWRKRA